MVCVSKAVSLLLHGFLMFPVGAEDRSKATGQLSLRAEGQKDAADTLRVLFEDEQNSICGGGKIRKWLTEVPSESSFRVDHGTQVEAEANAFLEQVASEIIKLTKEVERLEKEIKVAAEKSAPANLDIAGVAKPILESILNEAYAGDQTQSGPEKATIAKCGAAAYAIRKQHKVPRGAYKAAKSLMLEKLTPVFENGKVRFGDSKGDSQKMLQMCGDLVGWDPKMQVDNGASYCDELCGNFAREALAMSGKYAGSYAGPAVKALEEQLAKAKADLQYNQDEEDECRRARDSLKGFAAELVRLNDDIKEKHDARMAAQDALDMAAEVLDEMMESEEGKSDVLARAQEEYGLSQAKVAELTGLVAAEKATERKRNDAVTEATAKLDFASQELAKAEAASVSLDEIRGLVTQTMIKMVAYHEVVIVKPIKALGLQVATDISEYFDGLMDEATSEKEAVYSTLSLIDKYCESTATKAFSKVKSSVDLTSLCEKGTAQEVGDQINTMVKQRADEVRRALQDVQNSLDLYRGQEGMSKEESDRLTEQGELEGLREVATVYSQSSYFSKYLTHWKLDSQPPNFLDLISSLKGALARLTEQEDNLKAALEETQHLAAQQLDQRKKMVALLKDAMNNNEIMKGKEAEAQQEVDAQEKLIEQQESEYSRLEDVLQEAQKAYVAAKGLLESTYKRGTNMK